MSASPAAAVAPWPALTGRRVVAVDVARGVALLAMMTVHVLPGTDEEGRVSTAYAVASGRASALFAVLARVGVALLTGGPPPPPPPPTPPPGPPPGPGGAGGGPFPL